MRPRLIVNADDYGFTPAVSAGIRAAHEQGIVTSTSVLIVAPSAASDLREAQRSCPRMGIGVHLTLTGGWRPAQPWRRVRSLTTRTGRLPSGAVAAQVLARARPQEVLSEWRAQIEGVIDAGVIPDHLDAHHHIAYRSLALTEVLLALSAEYALPVRLPVGAGTHREPDPDEDRLIDRIATSGTTHPLYLRVGPAQRSSLAALLRMLDPLQPGTVVEVACHPGKVDWRLRLRSAHVHARERELALLTDARLEHWLDERDVELTTFSCLATESSAVLSDGSR